ncbi:FkbM family methyltransferase [Parahalioglobus pacificus]|uniref:Methyltransferase FkbM domain-containing protein n=1 Tax=Parahalioglobus pacificus TaxID=930806 RepID=A0A918XFW5_9GAMM|nr:FkbM family methyltransferase [Halioglobus pacificus]GHD30600.1 hypothetical protein GCM10007053_12550 [Halioglobus pacificus]
MLKPTLKRLINSTLALFGYRVIRTPLNRVGGIDLFSDIAYLVKSETPTCIDVGANVGQTIDALLDTFSNPLIHSFEPSLKTFQTLQRKPYAGRVVLHNLALGSAPAEREFINYKSSVLSSFLPLDPGHQNRFRDVSEVGRENVQLSTVDCFLAEERIISVDLLKIDTQGFDLEVLRGAHKSLTDGRIQYVLVEINFVGMYQGQSSAAEVTQELETAGFRLIDYYEKVREQGRLAWCTALFGRS